jgi:hypothetical protein
MVEMGASWRPKIIVSICRRMMVAGNQLLRRQNLRMARRAVVVAHEPHEVMEGCFDCPHPDYCAGMGKCEIGTTKLAEIMANKEK